MAKTETCPGGESIQLPDTVNVEVLSIEKPTHKNIANGGPCIIETVAKGNSHTDEGVRVSEHCGRCDKRVTFRVFPKNS